MRNQSNKIFLILIFSLLSNIVILGKSSNVGYEEDPDNFESFWRDGIKVMVGKLPIYERANINSKVIYEIPYGTKGKYKLSKNDYAWMMIDAGGHVGYTLTDGCSFNGINEEKGKAWFESEINNMIATLRENSNAYDEDLCMEGYEQEAPVIYEKYDDNPGDIYYEPGAPNRLFFYVGGSVLAFIVLWLISRYVNNTLSYFIKTFGGGACFILIIINLAKYVEIRNVDFLLPYYGIVALLWAAWWKYYFYNMALDLEISNENIKVNLFCTIVAACIWIFDPVAELNNYNVLIVIVAAILLWIIDSPTRRRCPNCHKMKAMYFNRREKAGLLTEETNNLNTKHVETRNMTDHIEKDYETSRTYYTNVYQMWRHYHRCIYCGYEVSKKKKGNRIASETRSQVIEKVTKSINK